MSEPPQQSNTDDPQPGQSGLRQPSEKTTTTTPDESEKKESLPLRKKGELYANDVRRRGGNELQRVLDRLLRRWGESTWPERKSPQSAARAKSGSVPLKRSGDFALRNTGGHGGVSKITARGSETRRMAPNKSDELPQEVVLARIMGQLQVEAPGIYLVAAIHYDTYSFSRSLGDDRKDKARAIGISISTYTNRLSILRTVIVNQWPVGNLLR